MSRQHLTGRHAGFSTLAVAVALALSGATAAHAADADASAAGTTAQQAGHQHAKALSAVTVSAAATPGSGAVAAKQSQDPIVDAITSAQITALPDATVVDAVRHVAGVSVTFNSDNANGRDEAQNIVIRGLDSSYNNINFDGAPMATTDQVSRGVRVDMLPASLVKEIDVYKTWQPDQDPNAVGGSILLVTRSAFDDGGKPSLVVNTALGHTTGSGKALSAADGLGKNADATLSTTFGPQHQFGLVLAANTEKRNVVSIGQMTSDNIFYNFYNANGSNANNPNSGGPNLGNGRAVPQQFKYWLFPENIERYGVDGKLEFRPDDAHYAFLGFGLNKETMREQRNEVLLDDSRSTGTNPVLNQTADSGQYRLGEAEIGLQTALIHRSNKFLQSGYDWWVSDASKLSVRGSLSTASEWNPRTLSKYIYGNLKYPASGGVSVSGTPGLGMSYDTAGFLPSVSMDPSNYSNLSNYGGGYWRTDNVSIHDRVGDVNLDFRTNMGDGAEGFGYAMGIDARRLRHGYNEAFFRLIPYGAGNTLAGVGQLSGYTMPHTDGLPFIVIDQDQAWAQALQNGHAIVSASEAAKSLAADYAHAEDTTAGYLMGSYRTDRLDLMVGVRQDDTRLSTTGNLKQVVAGTTSWSPQTNRSNYSFTLPAASLVFNATDSLRLKASASKTIGRPTYDDYAPGSTLTQNTDGTVGVTRGNPDIKPRVSINLDTSAEWYLSNATMLSLALFHKNIQDEIYSLNTIGQVQFEGTTHIASITQPVNAAQSSLRGAELGFSQGSLGWINPWLTHWGFYGNLTVLQGHLNTVRANGTQRGIDGLVNQPKQIRNLAVFYDDGRFGAELSYNWTGRALRLVDGSLASQDVYWKHRAQFDLGLHYRLTAQLSTFFKVANLTRSAVTSVTGPQHDLLKDTFSIGRTYWLGVKFTPDIL